MWFWCSSVPLSQRSCINTLKQITHRQEMKLSIGNAKVKPPKAVRIIRPGRLLHAVVDFPCIVNSNRK